MYLVKKGAGGHPPAVKNEVLLKHLSETKGSNPLNLKKIRLQGSFEDSFLPFFHS